MGSKYKIAIDCRMFQNSGIGRYLENILANLVDLCAEVSFLLIGNPNELSHYADNPTCEILPVDIPIFSLKEMFDFPVKDVNQCTCFYSPNYNIPLGIKVPIISTIHDVLFLDIPGLISKFKKSVNYLYLKQAISRSNLIFTVSKFSKDRILLHFPKANNIVVTYNGISEYFNQVHEIPPFFDFRYFLYVGNVKPHKGLECLLSAYKKLENKNVLQKLVIVGDVESFKTGDEQIKFMLKQGAFSKNIIFTGRVTDKELVSIMKYADKLIQPSLYEGFGIPPLESLSLGTPVILSDITVFKEIYQGYPVEYFQCNDADDLAVKMGNNNLQRIELAKELKERYSYRKSAEIILKNIIQIL